MPVKLGNTSITSIDVVGEKMMLVGAGSTEHLSDEQVTGVATALPGGP